MADRAGSHHGVFLLSMVLLLSALLSSSVLVEAAAPLSFAETQAKPSFSSLRVARPHSPETLRQNEGCQVVACPSASPWRVADPTAVPASCETCLCSLPGWTLHTSQDRTVCKPCMGPYTTKHYNGATCNSEYDAACQCRYCSSWLLV
jgi:hypothetical protein